jgi:hypothetical protein
VISTFQASDQIQKFKVTICDLEGFGGPRTPFKDWSAEDSERRDASVNWSQTVTSSDEAPVDEALLHLRSQTVISKIEFLCCHLKDEIARETIRKTPTIKKCALVSCADP